VSSPATTAFKLAWRHQHVHRVCLAKIDISTPSAKTLRYATFECDTPDGNTWVEGLRPDPIRESVSLLAPGMNPSDASIYLAKRRDPNQTGSTDTNQQMLATNLFANAIVTIYLWVVMPPELAPLSASDLLQVYRGRVSRIVDIDHEGMRLLLLQDMSWNRQVPPTVVDKISYPDSPDVSQGAPIPIIYGDHSAPKMRAPWTTAYGNRRGGLAVCQACIEVDLDADPNARRPTRPARVLDERDVYTSRAPGRVCGEGILHSGRGRGIREDAHRRVPRPTRGQHPLRRCDLADRDLQEGCVGLTDVVDRRST